MKPPKTTIVAATVGLAAGASVWGARHAERANAAPAQAPQTPAAVPAAAPAKRLNVLFIAVDDLNNSLGCYGNPVVKSPNIDRLARRGVLFERAYCQMPWCSPSRVSLLSGRRPDTTRVVDLNTPPRTHLPGVVFLPEHFKNNGYFTARVGKIYHESPSMKGSENDPLSWDVSEKGFAGGKLPVARGGLITGRGTRSGQGNFPGFRWAALDGPDEKTSDGVTARRAVALLEQATKNGKPFFIAAGFRKPPLMWEAPKKYFDQYRPEDIRLPDEPPDHLKNVPDAAKGVSPKTPPLSEADRRQAVLSYYACVSFTDAQVGLLLDAMDRLKLWDNTVVVLFGDHGYQLGEHGGQWEKVKLWEESIRAPLLIAAPGLSAGGKSPRVVEFLDIYPTLVDLGGLPPSSGLQGVSLAPLLRKPDAPWERAAFTVLGNEKTDTIRARSVRTERWHFVEYGNDGSGGQMLYDHASDPREYRNLADDPKHAATVAEMKRRIRQERERIGAAGGKNKAAVPPAPGSRAR